MVTQNSVSSAKNTTLRNEDAFPGTVVLGATHYESCNLSLPSFALASCFVTFQRY